MRTVLVTLYKYAELTDTDAQERARRWYQSLGQDDCFAWDNTVEDAKNAGLLIEMLDDTRGNIGSFETSAPEVAETICNDHGEECDTYKTAHDYLRELDNIGAACDAEDGTPERTKWEADREELDAKLLNDLLENYKTMLEKDEEYHGSDDYIAEALAAGDWDFTKGGHRFPEC